jgi:adhesin/invasin
MIARRWTRAGRTCLAAVAMMSFAFAGCDRVPLTAPTESTINLFATSTSVASTGSTDIVATVVEQAGTPVQNGTVVSFTTTLGRIEPSEARTQNGKVTVRFTGDGRSGTATITAFSGAASNATLELPVGSAAAETVTLRAEPARIGPNGGTAQVVALVRDVAGNPLPGATVAFTTTAGQLSAGTAQTDNNGEARVTLTTAREATVTATVGGATATVTVSVDTAPSVSVTVTPAAPVEDQTVTFALNVSSTAGSLPITQAQIDFGDGTTRQLGALPNGTTSVAHVYRDDGTYTVTLTLTDAGGNVSTQRTIVVVSPAAPIGVTLSYTPATPMANQVVTFTAATTLPSGVSIERYEWDFGDGTTSVTTGNQRTKIYTSAGTRKVRVRAVGTNGATGLAEADIVVQ